MHDFAAPQKCSKCDCPEYILFVVEAGQGIRCIDCGHEKIICRAQTARHKTRFRDRMKSSWDAQKTKDKY
jgi:hypothetical protein